MCTIGMSSRRPTTTVATAKFSYRTRTLMPGSDMHRSMVRCRPVGNGQTAWCGCDPVQTVVRDVTLGQCVLHRPARELRAPAQAGLLADAREVVLHRARGDVELLGDLLVGAAAGDQAKDLVLALAQQRADGGGFAARGARVLLEQVPGEHRRDDRAAAVDGD